VTLSSRRCRRRRRVAVIAAIVVAAVFAGIVVIIHCHRFQYHHRHLHPVGFIISVVSVVPGHWNLDI